MTPEIVAAFEALNALLALQVKLIPGGSFTLNQQQSLMGSLQAIILNLPLLWQGGVPDAPPAYSATAGAGYSQAQIQTLMNQVTALTLLNTAMLAGERSWQTTPGAPT